MQSFDELEHNPRPNSLPEEGKLARARHLGWQKLPRKIGNQGAAGRASGEGGGEEMYKDGWGSRARSVDARQSPGRDAGRSSSLDSIVYL